MDIPKKKPRVIHRYPLLQPGETMPDWEPPEAPEGYDENESGPWAPEAPTYDGPDVWDGDEPLFKSYAVIALKGAEEEAVVLQSKDAKNLQKNLVLRSWVEIDDRRLDKAHFEDKNLWSRLPPMVRDLINDAYARHNLVPRSTTETFRKGHARILRED